MFFGEFTEIFRKKSLNRLISMVCHTKIKNPEVHFIIKNIFGRKWKIVSKNNYNFELMRYKGQVSHSKYGKLSKVRMKLRYDETKVFKAWIKVRHTRPIRYTRHVRHAMHVTYNSLKVLTYENILLRKTCYACNLQLFESAYLRKHLRRIYQKLNIEK